MQGLRLGLLETEAGKDHDLEGLGFVFFSSSSFFLSGCGVLGSRVSRA